VAAGAITHKKKNRCDAYVTTYRRCYQAIESASIAHRFGENCRSAHGASALTEKTRAFTSPKNLGWDESLRRIVRRLDERAGAAFQ
jgi:hypothetical protein